MTEFVLTPAFRVASPRLIEPETFIGPEAMVPGRMPLRYSCVALLAPALFGDTDKLKWTELLSQCNDLALDTFAKPLNQLSRRKLPFHYGEAGVIYFTMTSLSPPRLVDREGRPLDVIDLYAGCYARASVYAQIQSIGIGIGMRNIQKLHDGEQIDWGPPR